MARLKQRMILIRELHEARSTEDPKKIRTAIETAESFTELNLKEHIDFTRATISGLEVRIVLRIDPLNALNSLWALPGARAYPIGCSGRAEQQGAESRSQCGAVGWRPLPRRGLRVGAYSAPGEGRAFRQV